MTDNGKKPAELHSELQSELQEQQHLVELEMRIAYLDDLVDSLNDQVARQEQDIMRLWEAHRLLNKRMETLREPANTSGADEAPPPHY